MNAVITGASKGIGKAIATALAKESYRLFLCSRNEYDLHNCHKDILQQIPQAEIHTMACDLSMKESCDAFASFCLSKTDRIDLLVNNAGQFIPGDISTEENGLLEHLIQTNVYSAYHLTRSLLPSMKEKQSGIIINISSVAGIKAYSHGGSYSISKFALTGFSKNLREELKPHQIKVCTRLYAR